MAMTNGEFEEFIRQEVEKYNGVMVPIRARFLESFFPHNVRTEKLHPNPDDEFCDPNVGPSYRIIGEYERVFRRYNTMHPTEPGVDINQEPLMVEKVRPDGYMLLNGHHRWAAGMRCGFKKMKVEVVNLTHETDILRMIRESNRDKRVTLDLDEVIFCQEGDAPEEHLKRHPNFIFKQKIRLGVPALLHELSTSGYDIWVYSSKFYALEYLQNYFRHYSVKVDGIVTGTGAKRGKNAEPARARIRSLLNNHYAETLHIDRDTVLRTFSDGREYEEYTPDTANKSWSLAVIDIIHGIEKGRPVV